MIFQSVFSSRRTMRETNRADTDAGTIVFLMMALVFVPILAAHIYMLWQDHGGALDTQQLATAVNLLLSVF